VIYLSQKETSLIATIQTHCRPMGLLGKGVLHFRI
jgi:hypothetical protein